MQRIEQRAQIKIMGREFVRAALEELRTLPKPARSTPASNARDRGLAATSDEILRRERKLDALHSQDSSLAVQRRLLAKLIGDSSLNFEIRAFVDTFEKRLRVQHEMNAAFDRALCELGIEILFPQRDLPIRSATGLGDLAGSRPAELQSAIICHRVKDCGRNAICTEPRRQKP